MKEKDIERDPAMEEGDPAELQLLPLTPIPFPLFAPSSGLYVARSFVRGTTEEAEGEEAGAPTPIPIFRVRDELRLDVDGRYPQRVASGLITISLARYVHWIARLRQTARDTWSGRIFYTDGATALFPYTTATIRVTRPTIFSTPTSAKLTLSGPGIPDRNRVLSYFSPYFHAVEFEFDCETGVTPTTSIHTHAHPNRPATLPAETLSVETVYRRAGFSVRKSGGDNVIGRPPGGTWSDMEMHDAMQRFWSRFANRAQWSMWVLFAGRHEIGPSLGGVMFDDIGPNERQGTAMFVNSFISTPPAGDPNPAAWVERMRFWTACHEMGHAFNLAHSWQKSLTVGSLGPWVPLVDEPEARSFMNYPYRVAGGQAAFFADFPYRFSDRELLFLRHAPGRFVQMGNADWFDHHGFRQAAAGIGPCLQLEARVNRAKRVYEFLEPITIELKLKNISTQPQLVPADILSRTENLTLIVKRGATTARQYMPFAHYCTEPEIRSLAPGESLYESVFVSADTKGWNLSEPGDYVVQAALHMEDEDIVSPPMSLRIQPPRSHDEEVAAQDYFSKDVGRVLAFDGSLVLTEATGTLAEVSEKFKDRRVARHAHVALGNALARPCAVLNIKETAKTDDPSARPVLELKKKEASVAEARKHLTKALTENMETSAESLGHIDYRYYVDRFTDMLADQGNVQEAVKIQKDLYKIMAARGVIERVLSDIRNRPDSYGRKQKATGAGA